ncbi:hypothetical protein [Flagellimonas allohymeniacidonis]|uniref:Uncharacterized protein n=1 Tax=Flagellimonas allohymeniacidonis TaxID=2517819 RepID=A0A4Q8QJL7_9FLAO|nr:hypothetical protein [Allomuricauda hymeniacidonis]TAI48426.1 hypothetical protein EW142_01060 [Allomuricauda hymeniacidonis]
MNNSGIQSHTLYLEKAGVEELYASSKEWKSDLDFFREDLQFLRNLMRSYFIWIVEKGNADDIRILNDGLNGLTRKCRCLIKKVDKHMESLVQVFEASYSEYFQRLSEEHSQLAVEVENLKKEFREVKKDVFVIAQHAIEIKKSQLLS